jgi:hypothetical protein
MASVYRDLVLSIEADATGDRSEEVLDRLFRIEETFVHERSDDLSDSPVVTPHEHVLQKAG